MKFSKSVKTKQIANTVLYIFFGGTILCVKCSRSVRQLLRFGFLVFAGV